MIPPLPRQAKGCQFLVRHRVESGYLPHVPRIVVSLAGRRDQAIRVPEAVEGDVRPQLRILKLNYASDKIGLFWM